MKEHYTSDKVVTSEEVRRAECHMNSYAKIWCKTFNIGESAGLGQPRRCARNLVGNYVTIPALQGLRKDHKGNLDGDETKGPKLRPLAAISRAPNAALGNLMARIAKAVGNDITERMVGEIISTEELMRDIDLIDS